MHQDRLSALPNELLELILSHLSTPVLLSLSTISRHVHQHVLVALHARLSAAATLDTHTLVLECYHPAARLSTANLYCDYIGTPGLDSILTTASSGDDTLGKLKALGALYSRFLPRSSEPNGPGSSPPQRRHPAGDVPGSRTHPTSRGDDEGAGAASRTIGLDPGEMFGQLCCATNLVKMAPRRNVMVSIVEVSDGLIRVFRDWLAKRAGSVLEAGDDASGEGLTLGHDDPGVLWVNNCDRAIGIKFRVRAKAVRHDTPVLYASDEEVAVSYHLDLEELLVRTSYLLRKIERSREQQTQELGHGKAIIFGTFPETS
ncbi:hypothetical protein ANO11243_029510 [Dothideomycetidae sp. 11243]|nr:hypothetical protein ANO11243_029510 [fungal sp. No.11243]